MTRSKHNIIHRIYIHILRDKLLYFSKARFFVSLVLAASSFAICKILYDDVHDGIVCAALFLFFGIIGFNFSSLNSKHPNFKKGYELFTFLAPLICVLIVCYISLDFFLMGFIESMGPSKVALNLLCAFVLYSFFLFITGRPLAACIITVTVLLTMSTINGFVYIFREKEFCVLDILSIRTAANVASQYSFRAPIHITLIWIRTAIAVFAFFSFFPYAKLSSILYRGLWVMICVFACLSLVLLSKDIPIKTWTHHGSQFNGFYLNFYLGIRDSLSVEPDGYSPEIIDDISEKYIVDNSLQREYPNIIVVMNESFSDLNIFENSLNTSIDPAPFISSLKENTVKGHALVSVYAGNTANSEFEFLSSHTMGFFPNSSNAVPYQQYISEAIYSIPHLANSLGYDSFATHPFLSSGWQRNTQYPRLGFQEFTFIEAYPDAQYTREYVNDLSMYEYMLELLTAHDDSTPLFLFGITMQNHSPYDSPGFLRSVELDPNYGDFPLTEQYLSLIHESDKAVEYLLGELENYPEDTVVLFFGDHMPMIEEQIFPLLNGGSLATLDEQMLKYTVPFFIWANYDIEEYTIEQTSLNYLAGHLLDAAGIELPPYYQFLRDTEEIIPAINAYGYYSKSKGCMIPLAEAEGEEAEALQRYSYVQYNNMFDAKNRNELFFGQYINIE